MLLAPASAVALMLGASCAKNPQINFTVTLTGDVGSTPKWVEVGIFEGLACPSTKQLMGGLPAAGYVSRLAFQSNNGSPPGLGDLKKATYAFAAVARADDCSVVGVGCTVADVTTVRDVSIRVDANQNPATACGPGTICDYARCVPSHDNGSIGAGCSMELVGAGPLADPLSFGTIVSAPAVAATDHGFLIGYREYDPLLGAARLTLIPVDLGGAAGQPQATTLPGQCPASDESDATALAFASGTDGVAAVARASCSDVGGVDLFQVDPTGVVAKSSFNGGMGVSITLATSRALAVLPDKSGYLLAFTENGETHVAAITNLTLQSAAAPGFGGAPPQSAGWIATSDKTIALLASGSGAAMADAGGGDAGDGGGGSSDGGPTIGTSLRLNLAPAGANLGMLAKPFDMPASFGSVAVLGARAFVVSDNASPDSPVTWRIFDLGKSMPGISDSFSVPALGKVLFTDVAVNQDHAFFAVEQPGAITLVAYDHATTTPTLLRSVFLPHDLRVPSMINVRDGRLAVAASDTRVAVVWTTGQMLSGNDVVGGYALFACTTP
jgi:hypothetical protein